MAKNSNKKALLEKRRKELMHAIANVFPEEAIEKRAERVRSAALGVIEKHVGRYQKIRPTADYDSWLELVATWTERTPSQIIELVKAWPENPTLRDLGYVRS